MVKKLTKASSDDSSIEDKFYDLETEITGKHAALFYGKPGKGKTQTASTFPKPMLYLNIASEEGRRTIKGIPGITVVDIDTFDEFNDLAIWLQRGRDFESVVLDQITSVQDIAQIWMAEKHRRTIDVLFGRWGKFWGELSGEIKTAFQGYRELKSQYNLVFLAHERVFDQDENADEGDLAPSVGARTMPSVGSFIEGACDIVGQCFIRTAKKRNEKGKLVKVQQYCMRIGPHENYITKIRRPVSSGPLPEYIVNPTYAKLVAIEAGEEVRKPKKLKRRE